MKLLRPIVCLKEISYLLNGILGACCLGTQFETCNLFYFRVAEQNFWRHLVLDRCCEQSLTGGVHCLCQCYHRLPNEFQALFFGIWQNRYIIGSDCGQFAVRQSACAFGVLCLLDKLLFSGHATASKFLIDLCG